MSDNRVGRREFLRLGAQAAAGLGFAQAVAVLDNQGTQPSVRAAEVTTEDPGLPWYRRTLRWGQMNIYRQPGRVIVHVVNLTNEGTWRSPLVELIPVGPLKLKMKLPRDVSGGHIECLVSAARPALTAQQEWVTVDLPSILDHEVRVIS